MSGKLNTNYCKIQKKQGMEKGENVYAMNCLKRHSENHQVRIIDRICAGIMNKFNISNV